MILGRDALIKMLLNKKIILSTMPDPDGARDAFEAWCTEYVQPASIDLPLGRYIWAIPTDSSTPGSQILYQGVNRFIIDPTKDMRHLFQQHDLTYLPEGAILGPGEQILAHTEDFVYLDPGIAAQVATRSTAKRWGLDVCGSAGWVDPGYHSRITLEIKNDYKTPIVIRKGVAYAQLVFMKCVGTEGQYDGHYNCIEAEWSPEAMLPKTLRH